MDRKALKKYVEKNGLDVTIKQSMDENEIREAIRKALKNSVEEDDEEVRTALDNGLHLPSNEKVEVKYAIGNSARSASINQTITTKDKESSSYNTDTKEAKVKVVIEENVNTRTQTVEQLMGDL